MKVMGLFYYSDSGESTPPINPNLTTVTEMRTTSKKLLLLAISILLLGSGCAVNKATAILDPATDLSKIKKIYVVKFAPDGREINKIIAKKLESMGFSVETGSEKPTNVDAVVTYKDKWMWDLSMYMLELTITIREPGTDYPMASGHSLHTSLTRKSPEEMVDEVINNIFKQGKQNHEK
jgi:hypothetical protein